MHVDLQKRFPIYHVYPQMHGGPSLRRGDMKEDLNIPSVSDVLGKTLVDW